KRSKVRSDDVLEAIRGLEHCLAFYIDPNQQPARAQCAIEEGRTLAMLECEVEKSTLLLAQSTTHLLTSTTPVAADLHHLIVLARLKWPADHGMTQRVAETLVNLDQKIVKEKRNRDSHWPPRIAELHAELAAKDPKLNEAILNHKDFGRPDHALFTR